MNDNYRGIVLMIVAQNTGQIEKELSNVGERQVVHSGND